MESSDFPVPPGRYLVTGGREVTTGLTVQANGEWKLDGTAALGDVTHLPCRAARYQPTTTATMSGGENGRALTPASPANANRKDFPVRPGAVMPAIPGRLCRLVPHWQGANDINIAEATVQNGKNN